MTEQGRPDADLRARQLDDWIAATLRTRAYALAPASADASFRRYFRVTPDAPALGERTLIAMDAPPPAEDCRPFVRVAALLADAGVHAPRVLAQDLERGFLLLTDLGTTTYLAALDEGNAQALFADATDALVRWQLATRPGTLPPYDDALLRRELMLFPEWYVGRHLGAALSDAERADLARVFDTLIVDHLAQPRVFVHRDYMPRNLMVSAPNPGVLDFQDAVEGPITYDILSLYKDAFRSWPEELFLDGTIRYWEQARRAGLPVDPDFAAFFRASEWMGLQRHLKVLGIFARIRHRDGKPGYVEDTPRALRRVRAARAAPRPARGARTPVRLQLLMPAALTAMILAAGRGERMRPLSDTTPKPLLPVGGVPLIVRQLRALAAAGVADVVINAAHLADRLVAALGDGRAHGVAIRWSREPEPLEAAGGIATAMPLLPEGPVLVVSGDVWTAYDYATLLPRARAIAADPRAARVHLVMVPNPAFHPRGDFVLHEGTPGRVATGPGPTRTYGNIGLFDTALFRELPRGTRLKLLPLLLDWIGQGKVTGEPYDGPWENVGSPADLARVDALFAQGNDA